MSHLCIGHQKAGPPETSIDKFGFSRLLKNGRDKKSGMATKNTVGRLQSPHFKGWSNANYLPAFRNYWLSMAKDVPVSNPNPGSITKVTLRVFQLFAASTLICGLTLAAHAQVGAGGKDTTVGFKISLCH
jgi:hypothetical protein